MKYYIILLFVLLQITVLAQKYLPSTIIVKTKPNDKLKQNIQPLPQNVYKIIGSDLKSSYPMFANHNSGQQKSTVGLGNIYVIKLTENNFKDYIKRINNLEEVEYAIPYYLPELLSEVNDPAVGNQYYLSKINAFKAHEITRGDTNIVIGITDTGLDLLHPDIIDNIKLNYNDPINGIDDDMDGFIDNFRGWDVADNDNNPARLFSTHGTIVAGMAAATCNNNIGIYSVGYNTKILPIKIMDSRGYLSGAYQGIVYAANSGCQIINCSWGSQIPNPLCDDVVKYAINDKNCLIVAAAGNSRTDQPFYPAACDGVLNVANTDNNDIKFSKSTYGIEVDICAPGTNVLSTYGFDGYKKVWGTSYSAPLVAGAAALIKAAQPELNGLQVGEQLRITADIIDTLPNNEYFYRHMGRGRLNAYNALTINNLPSLRISDLKLTGENSTPLPGDILSASFTITNYLAQISSTVTQLTIESEYANPTNNIFTTDTINTLESVSNTDKTMNIEIAKNTPYDEIIELDFRFDGPGYNDYQIFKHLINPSFINVSVPPIETSFTSNGSIGFANTQKVLGKGLIYDKLPNFLPIAGIILGNGRENLASALLDEYDFNIKNVIDTSTIDNELLQGKTSYICGDKFSNLPIEINQTSKIYYDEKLAGVIFHEYELINTGDFDLNDFAFSIFADWDIDNSKANHSGFNKERNLLYIQSSTYNNIYAGISLISQDTCVPYAFDLVEGGNGGLDIITDFGDEKKWFAMTNPRYNDNNLQDTIDVAHMISSPKIDLSAKDTAEFIFCVTIANSYYSLVEKTRLAHEKYENNIVNSLDNPQLQFSIYPNPAFDHVQISGNINSEKCTLYIYSSEGKLYSTMPLNNETEYINTEELSKGVYYFIIRNNSFTRTQKVVIIK